MPGKRYLIVNADDFGQSPGINKGIIEGHEHGIVTSASLMVRWPAAVEAAAYSRTHPKLSLGVHIDLGEWSYREGTWVRLYEVVPLEDAKAVKNEVANQLAAFRRLSGKEPSHIDSHQHVHLRDLLNPIFVEIAHRFGIPLRHCSPTVRYCGEFYGQTAEGAPLLNNISTAALIKILGDLPSGLSELGCHPAKEIDLDTMYRQERLEELKVLCDCQMRKFAAKMNIELCSFYDVLTRILS